MYLSTRGLVLRDVNYRDADKILTILTETEGRLTVSARGVRKKGSKFTAASQLLAFSDMDLYERQGKWYMREARTIELFQELSTDIELLSLGSYFAELLEAVSDEDSQNPEILPLGLRGLYILSKKDRPVELIKAAFELRLMCLAGYAPFLEYCPNCMAEPGEPYFDLLGGTIICRNCRSDGEYVTLCPGSYSAMKYITGAAPDRVFSFTVGEKAAKRLGAMCERYIMTRLERSFKTLDFWKGIR